MNHKNRDLISFSCFEVSKSTPIAPGPVAPSSDKYHHSTSKLILSIIESGYKDRHCLAHHAHSSLKLTDHVNREPDFCLQTVISHESSRKVSIQINLAVILQVNSIFFTKISIYKIISNSCGETKLNPCVQLH